MSLPETRLAVPLIGDYAYIASCMRSDEVQQFLAMSGLLEYVPDVAARAWVMTPGPTFALIDRTNRAVAVAGFCPVRPGVYEAWAAAPMEGWDRYWRAFTKACRRRMDELLARDAHRIQICALASRTQAHDWYVKGLKMTREGLHEKFCADGSDAVMFARVRPTP